MNIEAFKQSILLYVNNFGIHDYIAYAWLILVFFVLILLSIVLAKRSAIISIFLLCLSLSILFIAPFIAKNYLDKYFRPTLTEIHNFKKLHFSDLMIVNGTITNLSNTQFHICDLNIKVQKLGVGELQKLMAQLKPFRKKSILIQESIDINTTAPFRVVIKNYTYEKDVNVSASAVCY